MISSGKIGEDDSDIRDRVFMTTAVIQTEPLEKKIDAANSGMGSV